jgi:type IV secretion system protein VirD4
MTTTNLGADLIHIVVIVVLAAMILWFLWWAFCPHGKVPHFRVQSLRLRMRLRLHPGHGFATALSIVSHWSRTASWWASKRTRPGLGFWYRVTHPSAHSMFCGRGHYRLGLRMPIQEHILMFGPPRAYKSGFFARAIANHPGAVVSTSTKGDMLALTAGIRQRQGRDVHLWTWWRWFMRARWGSKIYVFNPQDLGPFASNIRWNIVRGCREADVAIRRAQALCEAASTEGTEEATFWSEQAALQMQAMLCAADWMNKDFRSVHFWILSGQTLTAEEELKKHGQGAWAAQLEQMRAGKAERTTATIRLVLSSACSFMNDPKTGSCVVPLSLADEFDIERFLMEAGSLYLIGEQRGKNSVIAPLFAGLVTEIQFMAQQMAGQSKGFRIDPPLLLALDEVTQIVPIPLPSIVADSGGRGIQLLVAAHGAAQLRSRWGVEGARTIMDCCNLAVNPGCSDPDTLELAERLAGKEWFKVPGSEQRQQLPIIPFEGIRQLPPKRSLIIRGPNPPVVARLPMGWRDPRYLMARLGGYALPRLAVKAGYVRPRNVTLAGVPDTEPVIPVDATNADSPLGHEELTPAGVAAQAKFVPPVMPPGNGASGNGHGGSAGTGNGNGTPTGAASGNGSNGNGHQGGLPRRPWPSGPVSPWPRSASNGDGHPAAGPAIPHQHRPGEGPCDEDAPDDDPWSDN